MVSNLPTISIAPYVSKTSTQEERLAVSKALHEACRDFGFFYLDATSFVSIEERNELVRLAREFFALSQEEKDKISIANEDLARGALLTPFTI
jgi:isopenicillin N synthase-like dioxygenase